MLAWLIQIIQDLLNNKTLLQPDPRYMALHPCAVVYKTVPTTNKENHAKD